MDMENNAVLISMDELAGLLDLKTRVDVLIERVAHDDFFRTEDVLRILGTDEAVKLADKLREKEEERMKKFRSDTSEGVDEAGDQDTKQ